MRYWRFCLKCSVENLLSVFFLAILLLLWLSLPGGARKPRSGGRFCSLSFSLAVWGPLWGGAGRVSCLRTEPPWLARVLSLSLSSSHVPGPASWRTCRGASAAGRQADPGPGAGRGDGERQAHVGRRCEPRAFPPRARAHGFPPPPPPPRPALLPSCLPSLAAGWAARTPGITRRRRRRQKEAFLGPITPVSRSTPSPVDPEAVEVLMNFDPDPADLALSSIPGHETFDPRKHRFSEEELKPQPIMKKARKIQVPDEQKDEKYWNRRYKNNEAAKRSRDARRLKENQITVRAAFLEKENAVLRQEVANIRQELTRYRSILSKYESQHGTL